MDSTPDDLKFDSDWLEGPSFLKKKLFKDWPIYRNFASRKIVIPTYEDKKAENLFMMKKEGASMRIRRRSGTMKTWAELVVCFQDKAVKIYLV